jgi:hypothetical protein
LSVATGPVGNVEYRPAPYSAEEVHAPASTPRTAGSGSSGGGRNVYKNVTTPFGTTDEFSSLFRIAKITPTVAYRFNERLSVGISLQVVYTDIRQKVFPETSYFDRSGSSVL